MKSFILIFLPAVLFGAQLTWDFVEEKSMGNYERFYKSFPVPDSGLTHIFWVTDDRLNNTSLLHFQTRFKNGTFTTPYTLSNGHIATNIDFTYSVKVSLDGTHILAAYQEVQYNQGKTHNKIAADRFFNIRFAESTNGGKTWTQPIWVLEAQTNPERRPNFPSMAFEEDTGRVFISFIFSLNSETEFGLAVKEPGSAKFTLVTVINDIKQTNFATLAITKDKAKSKRYLHVLWMPYFNLYYTRSEDDGRTWTPSKLLAKVDNYGEKKGILVSDYNIFESGLFVQYDTNQDIRLLYSQNHGDLWVSTRVGSSFKSFHTICLCGYKGMGKIFSMNANFKSAISFIRYQQPFQRFFTNAVYPFSKSGESGFYDISCGYDKKGSYAVSAIVTEYSPTKVHMAFGTLNETG